MKKFSDPATTASSFPFGIKTLEQLVEENSDRTITVSSIQKQFNVVWLKKGDAYYNNGYDEVSAKPNSVFCLHSSSNDRISLKENSEGYIIFFSEDFLKMYEVAFDLNYQATFMHVLSKVKGILVHDALQRDLDEIIARIMREYSNAFSFKTEILIRYVKIFLIYLSRQLNESFRLVPQTRGNELVNRFINELETNFREKKMVADYAKILFVTPNYLNEIIKKITGNSAGHHIRNRIVLEAKRMTLSSASSMKQIAYDLGFADCAHFSKFFKATTGINFTDFKKEKLTFAAAAA